MDDIELSDWDDLLLGAKDDCFVEGEGAYIKREIINFSPVYAIYDTDGQLLAHTSSRYEALLMVRRNDLTPYDAH